MIFWNSVCNYFLISILLYFSSRHRKKHGIFSKLFVCEFLFVGELSQHLYYHLINLYSTWFKIILILNFERLCPYRFSQSAFVRIVEEALFLFLCKNEINSVPRSSQNFPQSSSQQILTVSVRIFLISFLFNTYVTDLHTGSCKATVSGASVFLFIGALSIAPRQELNHMSIHT